MRCPLFATGRPRFSQLTEGRAALSQAGTTASQVAASAASFLAAAGSGWCGQLSTQPAILLVACCVVCGCAGCCLGLGWGLLLGSSLPNCPRRFSRVLLRLLESEAAGQRSATEVRRLYREA